MTRAFLYKCLYNNLQLLANIVTIILAIAALVNKVAFLFLLAAIIIIMNIIISKITYNPISLFKCIRLDFNWDIQDDGHLAEICVRRRLVSLCSNQKFYKLQGLYSGGKLESISCDGLASVMPIFKNANRSGMFDLLCEFYNPLSKGEEVEFSITRRVRDSFLNNIEDVTVNMQHETDSVIMVVKLPENKHTKNIFAEHYHGQAPQTFDKNEFKLLREGNREIAKWERNNKIQLNDVYAIRWEW